MSEESKDGGAACAKRCGGCKFLMGMLAGLLLAAAACGIYMAGRCSTRMCAPHHGMGGLGHGAGAPAPMAPPQQPPKSSK